MMTHYSYIKNIEWNCLNIPLLGKLAIGLTLAQNYEIFSASTSSIFSKTVQYDIEQQVNKSDLTMHNSL